MARAFWPGPLTLVLPKRPEVPPSVTAGLDTVAVRVPSHAVARALLAAARIPVAAPSANRSTEVSPTTAAHVEKSLGDAVDLILDGGPTTVGIESTVVDVTVNPPLVLRPGMITRDDLLRVVGELAHGAPAADAGDEARRSPGMLDRHYAPRAQLVVADRSYLPDLIDDEEAAGLRVGAILYTPGVLETPNRRVIVLSHDPAQYAAGLYAALHELDDAGVEVIVVEEAPQGNDWLAVRDRLARAAHR